MGTRIHHSNRTNMIDTSNWNKSTISETFDLYTICICMLFAMKTNYYTWICFLWRYVLCGRTLWYIYLLHINNKILLQTQPFLHKIKSIIPSWGQAFVFCHTSSFLWLSLLKPWVQKNVMDQKFYVPVCHPQNLNFQLKAVT